MQDVGEADQGVECWLGRPCLIAADLVDVEIDGIGEALLGVALRLAELGEAGGKFIGIGRWKMAPAGADAGAGNDGRGPRSGTGAAA